MGNIEDHPILLFDGVCNLCNGITQFVIRHDPPPGRFRFAALQSEAGQRLLQEHGLPTDDLDSFVMIDAREAAGSGNSRTPANAKALPRAYVRSTAALRTLRTLGFPWSLMYIFVILPRPIRDAIYDWIARHRYRWFGKRDACMMPTPEIQSRFLNE
ncbi:MAG: thiol-disulfide oxidoreductase DCC family protein [Phycisphaerales bacterium]|nr:thiol-disulfide oxidoreductase DCC family protein [Phycisphaerales bacterium]MCI0675750.1 thiol-disulfide oxidoreductase DCC family protein [Phycisphaerales bacterium]